MSRYIPAAHEFFGEPEKRARAVPTPIKSVSGFRPTATRKMIVPAAVLAFNRPKQAG